MRTRVALLAGTGLLLVVLAVPLIRRRVPPNGWYGLRVHATFADEWVWYEANAKSGRDLMILGVLQILLALGLPMVPGLSKKAYVRADVVALTIGALLSAGVGWWRANRLLEQTRRGR